MATEVEAAPEKLDPPAKLSARFAEREKERKRADMFLARDVYPLQRFPSIYLSIDHATHCVQMNVRVLTFRLLSDIFAGARATFGLLKIASRTRNDRVRHSNGISLVKVLR